MIKTDFSPLLPRYHYESESEEPRHNRTDRRISSDVRQKITRAHPSSVTPKRAYAHWNQEDTKLLMEQAALFPGQWEGISQGVFDSKYSGAQCRYKYLRCRKLIEGQQLGRWTQEMNGQLIEAAQKYPENWSFIGALLQRDPENCRKHYEVLQGALPGKKKAKHEPKSEGEPAVAQPLPIPSVEAISDSAAGSNPVSPPFSNFVVPLLPPLPLYVSTESLPHEDEETAETFFDRLQERVSLKLSQEKSLRESDGWFKILENGS